MLFAKIRFGAWTLDSTEILLGILENETKVKIIIFPLLARILYTISVIIVVDLDQKDFCLGLSSVYNKSKTKLIM